MKKIARTLFVLLFFGVAAQYAHAQGSSPPFKMLFIGPLSGPAAPLGKLTLAAYEGSVADVNEHGGVLGRKIELKTADTGGQGTRAASLLQEALNAGDKPDAVAAGVLSNETLALLPILTQYKLIGVSNSSSTVSNQPSKYPYMFLCALNVSYFANYMGGYLKEHNQRKVAILTPNDALGQTLEKSYRDGLAKSGLNVVTETYSNTDLDLTAPLQRIADAHPDALVFSAVLPNIGPLVLDARNKVGLDVPTYGDVALTADLAGLSSAEKQKNVYIANTRVSIYVPPEKRGAVYNRFLDDLKKAGPINSTLLTAANGWDNVQVLALAYNQAGSADPDKVKAAYENLRLPAEKDRRFIAFKSIHFSAADHMNSAVTNDDFLVVPLGPRVDGAYKP